ncbi:hypothetical protein [Cyanobacterium sp. Dongsha4]|nr:hypothetical protein [Cyanobacterium sp. Dongsha4]
MEELTINSRFQKPIRLDWGYWEAKDEKDSLDAEIKAKKIQ